MTFIVAGCESRQISILEDNLSFPFKIRCHQDLQVRLLCRWSLAFAFIRLQLKGWESLPRLDHLPLFLITKVPGEYKTERCRLTAKEGVKNFTSTKRWKKSHRNSFYLLCPALSDVGIAWSSQGKFTRFSTLQYLFSFELLHQKPLYRKNICKEKHIVVIYEAHLETFLLFTVSSRIKILRWSISPSLFS